MVKMISVAVFIVAIMAGIGSRYVFKKTDNPVEEIVEEIIKKRTGEDIDLSPETPEVKIKRIEEVKSGKNKFDK